MKREAPWKPCVVYILPTAFPHNSSLLDTTGRHEGAHWIRSASFSTGVKDVGARFVPRAYLAPVRQGVMEAMQAGVLAGHPVVDVGVTVYDGSYHAVDSSELAYRLAGSLAFKEGARKASGMLLEPIMKVEVVTPDACMGELR